MSDFDDQNGNILPFARPAREEKKTLPREPLINLPPLTKAAVIVLLLIHAGISFFLTPVQTYEVYSHFGLVPEYYSTGTSDSGFWPLIVGPFTYMLIHGSWFHVLLNAVMLAAFGAGLERRTGGAPLLLFFTLCSMAAGFVHCILNLDSSVPVIGASGGLSGLFAAGLVMLYSSGAMPRTRFGLWPAALLWIGISALFGYTGGPDGSSIAWEAHVGGFIAGFLLLKPILRLSAPRR